MVTKAVTVTQMWSQWRQSGHKSGHSGTRVVTVVPEWYQSGYSGTKVITVAPAVVQSHTAVTVSCNQPKITTCHNFATTSINTENIPEEMSKWESFKTERINYPADTCTMPNARNKRTIVTLVGFEWLLKIRQ